MSDGGRDAAPIIRYPAKPLLREGVKSKTFSSKQNTRDFYLELRAKECTPGTREYYQESM